MAREQAMRLEQQNEKLKNDLVDTLRGHLQEVYSPEAQRMHHVETMLRKQQELEEQV